MQRLTSVKPIELFLALGLATTTIACSPSGTPGNDPAAETNTTEQVDSAEGGEGGEGGEAEVKATPTPESSEGGEGGEGGESGSHSGSVQSDEDYLVSLGLMKGHLVAAKELLANKDYAAVEQHVGHPGEEIYGSVEDHLATLGVEPFQNSFVELLDLIKTTPEDPAVAEKFDAAVAKVDGAIAAIPAEKLESPEFVLPAIVGILKVAAKEYQASIIDGKFVEPIEYQDSRGFVIYANELFGTVSDKLDADTRSSIEASLKQLLTIWPTITPPATPVADPSEVLSLVSAIELKL
jgi:hypothetical protein